MEGKVLSIVIISWNSLPMLKECLASLGGVLESDGIELVWVDNGSTDGAAEWISCNFPGAVTEILPENRGVAYARNRGVEKSSGKYILFLDDDTIVGSEAIGAMIRYMDSHPHVGICGVSLVNTGGQLQDSFKEYPGLGVKIRNVFNSLLKRRKDVKRPVAAIEVEYLIGACQMIRREVFAAVGLLDENIFYGPEDADFCIRAHRAGYGVVYLPVVSIIHHWRRVTSVNLFSPLARKHFKALIYFYRKHNRWW